MWWPPGTHDQPAIPAVCVKVGNRSLTVSVAAAHPLREPKPMPGLPDRLGAVAHAFDQGDLLRGPGGPGVDDFPHFLPQLLRIDARRKSALPGEPGSGAESDKPVQRYRLCRHASNMAVNSSAKYRDVTVGRGRKRSMSVAVAARATSARRYYGKQEILQE